MDKEYQALLEKAYEELPDTLKEHSRFVIPTISSRVQGKTTVVQLGDVSRIVNRSPDMLAKYLIHELGTSGTHDAQRLVLKGQFRQPQVQEKFNDFLNQFVICPECGRPDTKVMQEKRINFLKCEACGSRHPLEMIRATQRKTTKKISTGDVLTLQITSTGKKGDGIARMGEYIIFVNNAREGQSVKAKVTGAQKNLVFAELLEIVR
ncbi:MAG: translation initiation factor IF-2 subunit beta [Candidatus Hydrothermarchaeaceae archaeon]